MSMQNYLGLKVCGLRQADNILAVAEIRPDYLGFIFYEGSARFVGADFQLPEDLDPSIRRVGVFVNANVNEISRLVARHDLTHVQLHGNESPELCAMLLSQGVSVIKAIGIESADDFQKLNSYQHVVTHFLLDTKSAAFGGSGRRFDWKLLRHYHHEIPFFLSGGIGPEHIAEIPAFSGMNMAAIDVNSSIEIEPGLKDVGKIQVIQQQLKQISAAPEPIRDN